MLLVSIQMKFPTMEIFETHKNLTNQNKQNKINKPRSAANDSILCKHCKRTSSNGIRCLGMCVADNDY